MAYGKRGGVNPRRAQQMRGNNRNVGSFKGGITPGLGGPAGQIPQGTQPTQQQCPAGQKSARNPATGEMECVPDTGQGVAGPGRKGGHRYRRAGGGLK